MTILTLCLCSVVVSVTGRFRLVAFVVSSACNDVLEPGRLLEAVVFRLVLEVVAHYEVSIASGLSRYLW